MTKTFVFEDGARWRYSIWVPRAGATISTRSYTCRADAQRGLDRFLARLRA